MNQIVMFDFIHALSYRIILWAGCEALVVDLQSLEALVTGLQ
jgi:hypothetical protein